MSLFRRRAVAGLALATTALGLQALPASANTSGTGLVISEVYGGGGNSGATYKNDFIELYNPTGSAISVAGWSVQYRSAGGVGANNTSSGFVTTLSGSVPAGGHYLVQESAGNGGTTDLPTADATGTIAMAATGGQVWLSDGTTALAPPTGSVVDVPGIVDFVGFGAAAKSYEGAAMTTSPSNSTAVTRDANGKDSDNNSADLQTSSPDPQNSGSTPQPPSGPTKASIAEIQGTGATSPFVGKPVETTGVVTAAYPTGGFNGFFLQTDGTGAGTDTTPGASDAVFVYTGSASSTMPAIGDLVDVTGVVSEYSGKVGSLTEITPAADGITPVAGTTPVGVTPLAAPYPTTDAAREAHEGELLAPTDRFTVTDTYSTNQYAEIGLATGDKPLIQPTEIADAQDAAAIKKVQDDNAARGVVLDDGSSTNFLGAGKDTPLPWLGTDNPIRVGARATFHAPVILDYRNDLWKLQPTSPVTDEGRSVVTIQNTRTAAPEAVGGNLRLATFNVLNYFNTTGTDFASQTGHTCTYYYDRTGKNPVTDKQCDPDGPRGAAEAEDLTRQQTKIVAAINALGADIVSLEEIENSVKLGEPNRDDALTSLVDALNKAAGSTRWAYAPSPDAADLPDLAEQDVIRTAFIYNPSTVQLVGPSKVLVGSAAFADAREPLAQAFKPKGTADTNAFAVIVNHFKSKGSGVDDGTGQGNANPDRVAQAQALTTFADDFAKSRNTDKVILTGDFNSYTQEDPMQVLYGAGYKAITSSFGDEYTYSFDGLSGSLDHVLANPAAQRMIAGADVWNINSPESVAFEYSRYNYNATDFYQPNMFRASDHDPEIVGLNVATKRGPVTLNLLGVNDFHGRINATTVKWAGTVEQLTQQGGAGDTLLLGAGDLIGASEFASAVSGDQPTIDMFNALGLDASSVGNHEFDKGWSDLRDRVIGAAGSRNALWDYLGANVYDKATGKPALPEYATFDVDGLKVGVIGAVTEETKSLVSPGGISDLTFGNPVDAVNRVAKQLSDGNDANGEADVIVAMFHAGATQGTGSNYDAEVAKGGEFAQMANLDPSVDAIFNGHTHQAYAWDAPVPGEPGKTRPIIQTGSYGDNVGQVQLTVDPDTGAVQAYTVRNVARTTVPDADLVASYPEVKKVKDIVDAALTKAAQVGNTPVGSITGDVTRAHTGGSYVGGKYSTTITSSTEDRGSESTIGDLVANALRDGLPAEMGHADLGIVNPGGLRTDLLYKGDTSSNPANSDGVVTYAEANSVLPFVNNIWTVDLTGAQLKAVLEQQWQPAGAARPFLALGLSDNVRVIQDPSKPAGSRITSVVINGEPLDLAKHYTVSTFSFLGTGGDNFTAFTQGTSKDTGLVDRDLWIGYLQHHSGIAPDFARQQVVASGLPTDVAAGDQVSFNLSKLNLTSLGSPENTSVAVYLRSAKESLKMGDFPVTNGSADVAFAAPADLTGRYTVVAVATPSGTRVGLPLSPWRTSVSATAGGITYGTDGSVRVTVTSPGTPTGAVEVADGDRVLGRGTLADGTATVKVPGTALEPGSHSLTVRYLGDEADNPSTATFSVTVAKAVSTVKAAVLDTVVKTKKESTSVVVDVSAAGVTPTGYVVLFSDGVLQSIATLQGGTATLPAGPWDTVGDKSLEVRYLGDGHVVGGSATGTVSVVHSAKEARAGR